MNRFCGLPDRSKRQRRRSERVLVGGEFDNLGEAELALHLLDRLPRPVGMQVGYILADRDSGRRSNAHVALRKVVRFSVPGWVTTDDGRPTTALRTFRKKMVARECIDRVISQFQELRMHYGSLAYALLFSAV